MKKFWKKLKDIKLCRLFSIGCLMVALIFTLKEDAARTAFWMGLALFNQATDLHD